MAKRIMNEEQLIDVIWGATLMGGGGGGAMMGGFNTFCPMLISLLNDIPFIDCDGAGRAVPALDTLLLHINGLDTSPLAMADDKDNQITITLKDPKDAPMGEEIGRWVCTALGQIGGLSGWMVKKSDIEASLPCGTVALCEKIGHELRACAQNGANAFEVLAKTGIDCKFLTCGKVVKTENLQSKGFDYGKVYVEGDDGQWIIYFQNENLLVEHDGTVLMTVPDITCYYNAENGQPLTNADIEEGMEICVGAVKAPEAW